MPNIASLFGDFFEDDRRSDSDLDAGTQDHIQRLLAQNADGRFDAMIAKTQAVHTAYFGARTATSGAKAVRKGTTTAWGLAEKALLKVLRLGVSQVKVAFPDDTDTTHLEARAMFYPQGMDPFNTADQGDWALLLADYDKAVGKHEAKLPAAFVTDYRQKKTALLTAIGKQSGVKGTVDGGQKDVEKSRKPVTMQLSENARNLGIMFAADPSRGESFFDARYFERDRNDPSTIAAGRQRAALDDDELPTDEKQRLSLQNVGDGDLLFARAADAKAKVDPAQALRLAAGTTATPTIAEVPGSGPVLVVLNPDPRVGYYRCAVVN